MPPFAGIGLCCSRPLAMYGPSSALIRAISLGPNRSGHINAPSRCSSSTAAWPSRGTGPTIGSLTTNDSPFSQPRGSSQPRTVPQCRRESYSMGIIRCVHSGDHSDDRMTPLTSSSCRRCMITTMADCLGSFRRVVDISRHQVRVVRRSASLSAEFMLWGSSMRTMSPPMPSSEPRAEVDMREPPALVSNCVLVFWSCVIVKRLPQRF